MDLLNQRWYSNALFVSHMHYLKCSVNIYITSFLLLQRVLALWITTLWLHILQFELLAVWVTVSTSSLGCGVCSDTPLPLVPACGLSFSACSRACFCIFCYVFSFCHLFAAFVNIVLAVQKEFLALVASLIQDIPIWKVSQKYQLNKKGSGNSAGTFIAVLKGKN